MITSGEACQQCPALHGCACKDLTSKRWYEVNMLTSGQLRILTTAMARAAGTCRWCRQWRWVEACRWSQHRTCAVAPLSLRSYGMRHHLTHILLVIASESIFFLFDLSISGVPAQQRSRYMHGQKLQHIAGSVRLVDSGKQPPRPGPAGPGRARRAERLRAPAPEPGSHGSLLVLSSMHSGFRHGSLARVLGQVGQPILIGQPESGCCQWTAARVAAPMTTKALGDRRRQSWKSGPGSPARRPSLAECR